MSGTSEAKIKHTEEILTYAENNLRDPKDHMFPWVVLRSMRSRIEECDNSQITVGDSHIRKMLNRIANDIDSKDDLSDAQVEAVETLHDKIDGE